MKLFITICFDNVIFFSNGFGSKLACTFSVCVTLAHPQAGFHWVVLSLGHARAPPKFQAGLGMANSQDPCPGCGITWLMRASSGPLFFVLPTKRAEGQASGWGELHELGPAHKTQVYLMDLFAVFEWVYFVHLMNLSTSFSLYTVP